jgi:hypothetical protein
MAIKIKRKFKHTSYKLGHRNFGGEKFSKYSLTIFIIMFAAIGGYAIYNVFAAPSTGGTYFATTGYQDPNIPRADNACTSSVVSNSWEPRAGTGSASNPRGGNYPANNTKPVDPSKVSWNNTAGELYWQNWIKYRNHVTGNYTGTTDQILRWAACKWGIDENIARADAVTENNWYQYDTGDVCGPVGEASYGILQIKNKDCSGGVVHGGYPDSQNETALAADFWGAHVRACIDNAFYDGGSWLYQGKTTAQWIALNGYDYVVWGCIGSWFSGNWYDSGAQSYITNVKSHLTNKDWLHLSSATTTASPDTLSPQINITAPTSGSSVSGTVNISASADDNMGVAGVQFKLDGANLGGEIGPTIGSINYSISWDASKVSSGSHTLTAVAKDGTGNITTSATVSVIVGSSSAPKTGDINHDNAVNVFDLSILLSKYNTTDSTADLNSDGVVNILDLSILLSHYGT